MKLFPTGRASGNHDSGALSDLIAAEKIDIDRVLRGNASHPVEERPPAWQSAMAADFESAKLDTYSGQRKELDRRVLSRYRVSDPELIATDEWFYDLPSYSISDACSYADLLLVSAQVLETQGDTNASEKYLSIARFGKLLRSGDSAWFGKRTQQAYARLAALAAKNSRPEEAAFYTFMADQERQTEAQGSFLRYRRFIADRVARWDADLARRSGAMMMLLSGSVVLITVFAFLLRSRSLRVSSLRPSGLTIVLGVSSSAALLVSSVVLRLSYHPYADIMQHFIREGGRNRPR